MNFPDERETPVDSRPRLKLKDKESVRGVFRGDIHTYHQHWVGDRSQLCPGRESCSRCKDGADKPQFKFRLNFITKEKDGFVAKIFEQGWTLFEQLKAINAVVPLEKTLVQISRSGSGKNDTTYTVITLPTPIPDLSKVELLRLDDEADEVSAKREATLSPGPKEEDVPW